MSIGSLLNLVMRWIPLIVLLPLTLTLVGQVHGGTHKPLLITPGKLPGQADQITDDASESYAVTGNDGLPLRLNREPQIRLCMAMLGFDPGAALSFLEQELEAVSVAHDAAAESRLLHCKADAHKKLGDSEAASQAYLAAVAIADKADDKEYLSIENLRSIIQFQEVRILRFKAEENFQQAFEVANHLRKLQSHLDRRLFESEAKKFESNLADLKSSVLKSDNLRQIEVQQHEKVKRNLGGQVVVLGTSLLALLLVLGLRQFYKKRRILILSKTDELTRLPNRQHILTFLGNEAKDALEEGQSLSVIAFEIDDFKQINEKNGHEAGDRVIKAVAETVSLTLRRGDKVGRIGGKQFLVVLPGSPKKNSLDVAERLRRAVEVTAIVKSMHNSRITVSLGVCEWNAGRESIDALLKRAHGALDQAKDEGRNRVVDR